MKRLSLVAAALAAVIAFSGAQALAGPKKGCPPGLAKQGRCGKIGYRKHDEQRPRYTRWDRWNDAGLQPAPRGQTYALVDDRVVLIDDTTLKVIRVIGALADLLN